MRVGRREFAWVFPQLPLLGQTSSESWRESFFFFRFPWFCSALLSRLIFSFFLLLLIMGNDLDIACFWFFLSVKTNAQKYRPFCWAFYNSHASILVQLSWPVKWAKPLIDTHQNLNQLKLMRVHAWECVRVDESWLSNKSESCDSHPRLIRPLHYTIRIGSTPTLLYFDLYLSLPTQHTTFIRKRVVFQELKGYFVKEKTSSRDSSCSL